MNHCVQWSYSKFIFILSSLVGLLIFGSTLISLPNSAKKPKISIKKKQTTTNYDENYSLLNTLVFSSANATEGSDIVLQEPCQRRYTCFGVRHNDSFRCNLSMIFFPFHTWSDSPSIGSITVWNNNGNYTDVQLKTSPVSSFQLIIVRQLFINQAIVFVNCTIATFQNSIVLRNFDLDYFNSSTHFRRVQTAVSLVGHSAWDVYHIVIEGILRIVPLLEWIKLHPEVYIIIARPKFRPSIGRTILELLGIDTKRIIEEAVFAESALILYPYLNGFGPTVSILELNGILRKSVEENIPSMQKKTYLMIFLRRTKTRVIENEKELLSVLKKNFAKWDIQIFDDRQRNLSEIFSWFYHADLVVGYHGAGLTNIIFCRKGTIVIEIQSKRASFSFFAPIGIQLVFRYIIFLNTNEDLYKTSVSVNTSNISRMSEFFRIDIREM